ncbi:hypothetical protein D3C78_1460010 [compost metagenome]
MPPASARRISNTVRSAPRRRARIGASGANRPRQSTGRVVSRPAAAPDRPVLSRTILSIGARLDSAGRRLRATRISPVSSSQGLLGMCAGCGASSISASISSSSPGFSWGKLDMGRVSQGRKGKDQISRARFAAAAASASPRSMASSIWRCRSKSGCSRCGSPMVCSRPARTAREK